MLRQLSHTGSNLLSYLLPAISCLLSTVTLDLSQYAMDIGKAIASKTLMHANFHIENKNE